MYNNQFSKVDNENVLLYGADDAGEIALRWILRNPSMGYSVAGFLDDDSLKWGKNIHGIKILGNVDTLVRCIQEKNVTGVIAMTETSLRSTEGEKLVSTCRANGIWVRVLHFEFELKDI